MPVNLYVTDHTCEIRIDIRGKIVNFNVIADVNIHLLHTAAAARQHRAGSNETDEGYGETFQMELTITLLSSEGGCLVYRVRTTVVAPIHEPTV